MNNMLMNYFWASICIAGIILQSYNCSWKRIGLSFLVYTVSALILAHMIANAYIEGRNTQIAIANKDFENYQYRSQVYYLTKCLSANAIIDLNGEFIWMDPTVKSIFSSDNLTEWNILKED